MGSLESWLLLRSLRTLELRVQRQSKTATVLVKWLAAVASTPLGKEFDGVPGGVLTHIFHSSLQPVTEAFDASKQMEGGWGATFAIKVCSVLDRPEVTDADYIVAGQTGASRCISPYFEVFCSMFPRKLR